MSPADPEVQVELREHDRRLNGLHRRVGELSLDVGAHKTQIAVLTTEQSGIREDLAEVRSELRAIKRGVWAAAGVGLSFVVAVFSLVIQLSG